MSVREVKAGDIVWVCPDIEDWIDKIPELKPEDVAVKSVIVASGGKFYIHAVEDTRDYSSEKEKASNAIRLLAFELNERDVYPSAVDAARATGIDEVRYPLECLKRAVRIFEATGNTETANQISKAITLITTALQGIDK